MTRAATLLREQGVAEVGRSKPKRRSQPLASASPLRAAVTLAPTLAKRQLGFIRERLADRAFVRFGARSVVGSRRALASGLSANPASLRLPSKPCSKNLEKFFPTGALVYSRAQKFGKNLHAIRKQPTVTARAPFGTAAGQAKELLGPAPAWRRKAEGPACGQCAAPACAPAGSVRPLAR
jgi:hypothetical protein